MKKVNLKTSQILFEETLKNLQESYNAKKCKERFYFSRKQLSPKELDEIQSSNKYHNSSITIQNHHLSSSSFELIKPQCCNVIECVYYMMKKAGNNNAWLCDIECEENVQSKRIYVKLQFVSF